MVSTYNANGNKEVQDILDDLRRIKEHKEQIKMMEEDLTQKLYNHVNEHDRIITVDADGVEKELATWKYAANSTRFDGKRFKEAHADLYKEFSVVQLGSRRLLLKD
jgi:archaellum component FlaC